MRSFRSDVTVMPAGRLDFIDLTDELRRAVKDAGVTEGFVVAYCVHTTCALIVNEMEDGALEDLRQRLEALVPGDVYYAHDDLDRRTANLQDGHERPNGRSHVAAMVLGATSHAIPVGDGEPLLGTWQRLLLVELDEPKDRTVLFHVLGE